jgi:hypothetical protein
MPGNTDAAPQARNGAQPPQAAERSDPAASLYEWEFRVPPKRRTALWALAALVLLVGAAVQAAIAFRDDLLAVLPGINAGYEQACRWLGCTLPLPRLADRLHVESSELRVPNRTRPSQIELTVLLRNRAPLAVEYPAFELALTDAASQVLARRVVLPEEYLPGGIPLENGFPSNEEIPIRLYLDTGSVAASGYRLYFFYP